MSGPLLCDKCGKEIRPGDAVEVLTADGEVPRIVVDDDVLIVHVECP